MWNLYHFASPSCEEVCGKCGKEQRHVYLLLLDGVDAYIHHQIYEGYCASCLLTLYHHTPSEAGELIARTTQPQAWL